MATTIPVRPDAGDRYLTLDQVSGITHLSKSTIRRLTETGNGPPVCRLSPKLLRWSESAVHDFMRARMEA
jgi:predicted DNA-binding transcriptional regulator AlpA